MTLDSSAGPSSSFDGKAHDARMIEELVLDAGPLLTQQQGVRSLAKKFYIPPLVIAELRDQRARDHLEWLRNAAGPDAVEVREPSVEARLAVTAFAKQTGDYAVLSQADMSVLALAYALEVERHGQWRIRDKMGGLTGQQRKSKEQQQQQHHHHQQKPKVRDDADDVNKADAVVATIPPKDEREDLPIALSAVSIEEQTDEVEEEIQQSDLDSDEDDEEEGGQWITPENIDAHKSVALGLVSDADVVSFGVGQGTKSKSRGRLHTTISDQDDEGWSTVVVKNAGNGKALSGQGRKSGTKQGGKAAPAATKMTVACMTGDYAVQNVLLQMGLSLVGMEGQRIRQVRAWVLRCHACFKICKDVERQSTFCPQCGNPTLLRTSVTSRDPSVGGGVQIHLKKNFQYKNRGTKYSLPLPKAGKASGGPQANVPILREDQIEWQRALAREKVQRNKEERALNKALERGEKDTLSARYDDADGLSILLAGASASKQAHGLPPLGVGRRNPNEKQRRKV